MNIATTPIFFHTRASGPALHSAAPAKAPMSEWDTLMGSPFQVHRSVHTIAAISAARIRCGLMMLGATSPLPIVRATCVSNRNAAMKLKKAAQSTAARGESTRVATTVAIELAASFSPLLKSKTSAIRTIERT